MKLKEYIKDELFKIILIIVYIILICGLLCAFNFGVQMAALMAVLAAMSPNSMTETLCIQRCMTLINL